METTEKKRGFLRTWRRRWMAAVVCLAVGAICFFCGRLSIGEQKELSAVVLQNRLTAISELASVTYAYTNMAQFESSNDFYGMTLPFTTKSFILTYDGEIKAGVDLSQAQVDLSGTAVTVTLPEAEILSHAIDESSVEVFDEKTSIFNPFTVEDFTAFRQDQQKEMEERAVEEGLLEDAAEQARRSVVALLSAALPEEYTLEVK